MIEMAALREGVRGNDIQDVIWMIRRLPKNPTKQQIKAELSTLNRRAAKLARKELKEAGVY